MHKLAILGRLLYNVNYTLRMKTRILKQLCLFLKTYVCYKELHKSVWGREYVHLILENKTSSFGEYWRTNT